ncbi:MAG TPA: chorismate mutase [Azospirillaceae bacterium]|nr:chorismate mutase [Azospirillaceae bacterium]HRQ80375.1 chorismate mutase [Azospirillaceae bacterium]
MTDSLIELRADIDAIDRDIIALLAKRFAVVHRVAVVKKREGLPAVLPERIAVVKRQARALAENAGLSPDFAESLYHLIIEEACRLEEEFLHDKLKG